MQSLKQLKYIFVAVIEQCSLWSHIKNGDSSWINSSLKVQGHKKKKIECRISLSITVSIRFGLLQSFYLGTLSVLKDGDSYAFMSSYKKKPETLKSSALMKSGKSLENEVVALRESETHFHLWTYLI